MMVMAVDVLVVFHFDGSKQQNCFKMSKWNGEKVWANRCYWINL